MIDDIALTKVVPLNQGMEDASIRLSSIASSLNDTDGSESLTLALGALPAGTVISDGQYIFTATSSDRVLDITQWNLASLTLKPPANFGGTLTLQIIATSIEVANGSRATAVRDLAITFTAQANAPIVTLTPRDVSLSRELVNTSWESALNTNIGSSEVYCCTMEGWDLVSPRLLMLSAFEVWSNGDKFNNVTVNGVSGHGSNCLHLNDGTGKLYQTLGVERDVQTISGAVYTLQFDYAGDIGKTADKTKIGIYVDGQLVSTYANTSGSTALNWQALSFQFVGNGQCQRIKIVLEGGTSSTSRGAMIDALRVVETLPVQSNVVYGISNQFVALPKVTASLTDTDGSETLKLQLQAIPNGSVITDGTRTFNATVANAVLDLSGWNLNNLSFKAPSSYCGDITLQVKAVSTESSNGSTASTVQSFTVRLLSGTQVATPVGVNPYATYTGSQSGLGAPTSGATITVSNVLPASGVTMTSIPGTLWEQEEWLDKQKAATQSAAWLDELEQYAQGNWGAFVGAL